MANTKISQLTSATTPLAGTETLPIVQSGATKQVAVSDLTAGRAVSAASLTLSSALTVPNGGTGLTSLTAGYIPFGAGTSAFGNSSNLFWDNTNARLGIGTSSPTQKLEVNGAAQFGSGNTTSSGGLALRIGVFNTKPSDATDAFVGVHNTGGSGTTAGDLVLMPRCSTGVNNNIILLTGQTNPAARLTIDASGNIYPTSGTTSMTNGFFYIPAAAGAPSGTPTSISGRLPMYYDSTNNNFYIYNGGWKKVALA